MTMETAVATERAVIAHLLPGRIRLKVPSIRGNAARAAEVEERLSSVDIVEHVAANPKTGSLVVEYAGDAIGSGDLVGRISQAIGVDVDDPAELPPPAADLVDVDEAAMQVRELLARANARLAQSAGGVDLRLLVPGALFCLGVGVLLGSRRRRMPTWYDLVWYAFNTFQVLNPPPGKPQHFTSR